MTEAIIFYLFSTVAVVSALMMISVRNPVRAAFYLVLSFFASAIIWLLLQAEFLAIVLVLVYVGAVMVLFLFVVMMLDLNIVEKESGFTRYFPIGIMLAAITFFSIYYVLGQKESGMDVFQSQPLSTAASHVEGYSNTKELGKLLYSEYVYAFEIAAMLLLVAIVAAISLTYRRRPKTRHQNPDLQVSARHEDRIRIVKIPVEERK